MTPDSDAEKIRDGDQRVVEKIEWSTNTSRTSVRFPAELIEDVSELVDQGHYPNQSEAIRDGVRMLVREYRRSKREELEEEEDSE